MSNTLLYECKLVGGSINPSEAGVVVNERIRQEMRHSALGYQEAMRRVLDADAELKRSYAALEVTIPQARGPMLTGRTDEVDLPRSKAIAAVGEELHRRVVARRRANPNESYAAAMAAVMKANPQLADAYSRGVPLSEGRA